MKVKLFAILSILALCAAIVTNDYFMDRRLREFIEEVEEFDARDDDALEDAGELFKEFMSIERHISLFVNHDDLENIEVGFGELVGAIEVGDRESAEITKSRLLYALRHLRRLSGLNTDSII